MKCRIDDNIFLSRAPEGPLAAHIEPFARSLSEQGYTLDSIHRQVLLAACFSRWLKQQRVALRSVTSDHPPGYLDTALDRSGRAGAMLPHSGICSPFCAVRAQFPPRRSQRAH